MTPLEIARAKEICEAATPGPWASKRGLRPIDGAYDFAVSATIDGEPNRIVCETFGRVGEEITVDAELNAAFIVAAREGWPAAIAEIERLTAELDRLRTRPVAEAA